MRIGGIKMNGNPTPKVLCTYGKMFDALNAFEPTDEQLISLGMSMHIDANDKPSTLPAGYTFLGQFIDHDMARDPQGATFPCGKTDPNTLENHRNPVFDLDVLYGDGPTGESSRLYKSADSILLRLGDTTPGVFVPNAFPNDLLRNAQFSATPPPTKERQFALIQDPRQDENLAIAQTHVAFIKFHNAVVKREFKGDDRVTNLEPVQEVVIRHFQWIVLKDFLPRVVIPEILQEVINAVQTGAQRDYNPDPERPFMPVEFSVAAFRMGHSMVSRNFNWNREFPKGSIKDLSDFTARGKMQNAFLWDDDANFFLPIPSIPSRWIIDWTRFYDFKGINDSYKLLNFASKIDTTIIEQFKKLMPDETGSLETYKSSLPVRNLFRGRMLGLPTGQAVAEKLYGVGAAISPNEISKNMDASLKPIFGEKTPLWYYILKEAELTPNEDPGTDRLGPVGSRIVAETMVGLMKISPYSILDAPEWRPYLYGGQKRDKYEMADLLNFVGDLNPIG